MAYTIVDWILDSGKVDYEGEYFPSQRQGLADALKAIGDKRINSWMRHDYLEHRSTESQRTLSETIDGNNQNFINTIIRDINTARTEEDLTAIESEIRDQRGIDNSSFEQSTINELTAAINERRASLVPVIRRRDLTGIERTITQARTFEDLAAIDTTVIPKGPERKRLNGLILDRFDELGITLETQTEDRLSRDISRAGTVEALESIDITEAVTTASERRLAEEVEGRRRELE